MAKVVKFINGVPTNQNATTLSGYSINSFILTSSKATQDEVDNNSSVNKYISPDTLRINYNEHNGLTIGDISGYDTGTDSITITPEIITDYEDNVASGDESISIGLKTKASGLQSIVMGTETGSTGDRTVVIGGFSDNTSNDSLVIGIDNTNSGANSIIFGLSSTNNNTNNVLIGRNNSAVATNSIVIGNSTKSSSPASVTLGLSANSVNSENAINIGRESVSTNSNDSINIGRSTITNAVSSIAIGTSAIGLSEKTITIGTNLSSNGLRCITIGNDSITDGSSGSNRSITIGNTCLNYGYSSIVVGNYNDAYSSNSILYGISNDTDSTSVGCVSLGRNNDNLSSSSYSISLGSNCNNLSSNYSIAIGNTVVNQQNSNYSIGMGYQIGNYGKYEITIGYANVNVSYRGISIGYGNALSGNDSVLFGNGFVAIGHNILAYGSSGSEGSDFGYYYANDGIIFGNWNNVGKASYPVEHVILIGSSSEILTSNTNVISIGNYNNINDNSHGSISMGKNIFIDGLSSVSIGNALSSYGDTNTIIGNHLELSGSNSFAFGYDTDVYGHSLIFSGTSDNPVYANNSVILGNTNTIGSETAPIENSIVIGVGDISTSSGELVCIGKDINVSGSSNAIGNNLNINGDSSSIIGESIDLYGSNSVAFGHDVTIYGNDLIYGGSSNTAISATNSIIFGNYTNTGDSAIEKCIILGNNCENYSDNTICIKSKITGYTSDHTIAIGTVDGEISGGANNTVIGRNCYISNSTSHTNIIIGGGANDSGVSFGNYNIVLGSNASIVGDISSTEKSIAIGFASNVSKSRSIAIGSVSNADGLSSIAIGNYVSTTVDKTAEFGLWNSNITRNTSIRLDDNNFAFSIKENTPIATIHSTNGEEEAGELASGMATFTLNNEGNPVLWYNDSGTLSSYEISNDFGPLAYTDALSANNINGVSYLMGINDQNIVIKTGSSGSISIDSDYLSSRNGIMANWLDIKTTYGISNGGAGDHDLWVYANNNKNVYLGYTGKTNEIISYVQHGFRNKLNLYRSDTHYHGVSGGDLRPSESVDSLRNWTLPNVSGELQVGSNVSITGGTATGLSYVTASAFRGPDNFNNVVFGTSTTGDTNDCTIYAKQNIYLGDNGATDNIISSVQHQFRGNIEMYNSGGEKAKFTTTSRLSAVTILSDWATTPSGNYATTVGFRSYTGANYATAIGDQCSATGANSLAIGSLCSATGTSSTAIGMYSTTTVDNTLEIGYWSSQNTRNSAIRIDGGTTPGVAFSVFPSYAFSSNGQYSDGGTTAGSESTGTIPRGMIVFQDTTNTNQIKVLYNIGGSIYYGFIEVNLAE